MVLKNKPRSLIEVIEFKENVKRELEKLLDPGSRRRALRDYHARRRPRPCGMTVHTGVGCDYACLYCYIIDMGFKWGAKPYPLSGLELAYALANNPFFIPGPRGTFIAMGSVTEPFLEKTREKAFEYIEAISRFLGNPIQFSTKAYLSLDDAKRLYKLEPGISPLVTIVTIKYSSRLEPKAPSPDERFESIENLARAGLKPILFLRPIIPGVNDREYPEILERAKKAGAVGVVAGSLRVTERILFLFEKIGINTREIKRRLKKTPHGTEQVDIDTTDIKTRILEHARAIGLKTFPMACMANLYTHNQLCHPMIARNIATFQEGLEKPPEVDYEEITEAAKHLGLRVEEIKLTPRGDKAIIKIRGDKTKTLFLGELIKSHYRICIKIQSKH
ncbi:radical SAM protein [Desulfurococcaceae archaeon MEX13E-LK6-19]|nr:radical SAM protein [Desulfurococcaceae archaeon MEX13E-LK6-19]